MFGNRPSTYRLLEIHRELKAKRFPNVPSLVEQLGYSEKTIRRDITHLRDDFRAPIDYDRHRRGFYYTRADFELPAIQLNEGELLAVFLGGQLLRQYRGTELGDHLDRLYGKLIAFLPDTVSIHFNDLPKSFATRPAPVEQADVNVMKELIDAVHRRESLDIVYYTMSTDLTQRRTIDPLGFSQMDGAFTAVAYCHLREEVRNFNPARIQQLTRTGKSFQPPADFDLTRYIDEGFRQMRGAGPPQTMTLRFAPASARFVQGRNWHPTQETIFQPDGAVLLRFRINHTLELKRLALSFGPDCEVLEPASLRDEIAADVRAMFEKLSDCKPTH